MSKNKGPDTKSRTLADASRRHFLRGIGAVGAVGAASAPAWGGRTFQDAMGEFFQQHYEKMSRDQMQAALGRIKHNAERDYGVDIDCDANPPQPRSGIRLRPEHLQVQRLPGLCECLRPRK